MKNLRNRSFLTLLDFSRQEVEFLLTLSEDLKRAISIQIYLYYLKCVKFTLIEFSKFFKVGFNLNINLF